MEPVRKTKRVKKVVSEISDRLSDAALQEAVSQSDVVLDGSDNFATRFQVSDAWLGFLTGPAFAMFYIILGIPVARYADRHNRRNLIAVDAGPLTARSASRCLARMN